MYVNYPLHHMYLMRLVVLQKTCDYLSTKITDDHQVCSTAALVIALYTVCSLYIQLLIALAQALGVYYNFTGSSTCLNISQDATSRLGERGWYFQVNVTKLTHSAIFCILQACTEMVMPMCSTHSPTNMFPSIAVSLWRGAGGGEY